MLNSIKTQAAVLAQLFAAHGVTLSRSQSLEYLAKVYGLADYNSLATHAKALPQEVTKLVGSAYRGLDQLRMNASASQAAIGISMVCEDGDLQEVARELAKAAYEHAAASGQGLTEAEQSHARCAGEVDYGPECVVHTVSGFSLASAAYPDEVDYLRILSPTGEELAYWTVEEIVQDPAEVLGAIMGALRPVSLSKSQNSYARQPIAQPTETTVNGYRGLVFSIEDAPEGDGQFTGAYVDFYLYCNVDKPGQNKGAEFKMHVFIDCQEKRLAFGDLGFAWSRVDGYNYSPPSVEKLAKLQDILAKPGVVQDTANDLLAALKKQHPKYTGWTFTVDQFADTLQAGLSRHLVRAQSL